MYQHKIKIAIIGLGNVGRAFFELIRADEKFEIVGIAVRQNRSLNSEYGIPIYLNWRSLLKENKPDVAIELIDETEAAEEIFWSCQNLGIHLITANKRFIHNNLECIIKVNKESKYKVLYEASCCGSIPIIRCLEEYYSGESIRNLSGIINGSTNFMLNRVDETGRDVESVIEEAVQLGFAESDPSLDTEAWDAWFKLNILLAHLSGQVPEASNVLRCGITRLSNNDFEFARRHQWKIKLLAHVEELSSGIWTASVLPRFLPTHHVLSNIEAEFNGIVLNTRFGDSQFFKGQGAGGFPTAGAVYSDLNALLRGYFYKYANGNDFRIADQSNWYYIAGLTSRQLFEIVQIIDKQLDRNKYSIIKLSSFQIRKLLNENLDVSLIGMEFVDAHQMSEIQNHAGHKPLVEIG